MRSGAPPQAVHHELGPALTNGMRPVLLRQIPPREPVRKTWNTRQDAPVIHPFHAAGLAGQNAFDELPFQTGHCEPCH